MDDNVAALMTRLEQARELLRKHGDNWVAGRLYGLERRLAFRDWTAFQSALFEATGGMGSLKDRRLSVSNGESISREEEPEVNAKLDSLIVEVERSARAAAAELGVHLIR